MYVTYVETMFYTILFLDFFTFVFYVVKIILNIEYMAYIDDNINSNMREDSRTNN